MSLPDACLRGISDPSHIVEGRPVAAAFGFDQRKPDGTLMQSVNWADDDGAVAQTLDHRKPNGALKFPGGAIEIVRRELDRISRHPFVKGRLDYERDIDGPNRYHGNLLLDAETPKPIRDLIQAKIAMDAVGQFYAQQNEN